MDLDNIPDKRRITSQLFVEALTNTNRNKGVKLDHKQETVPSDYDLYFNKTDKGGNIKKGLNDSENKIYSHKTFKYTDKELILLNLYYHGKYNNDTLTHTSNQYVDRALRARMVADFLQSFTSVPIITRKLSRNNIKVSSLQFPIHPKHTSVGDINPNSTRLDGTVDGSNADPQFASKKTWKDGINPSTLPDSPVLKSKYTHLSLQNVSGILKRLHKHIVASEQIVNELFTASEVVTKTTNSKVTVPKEIVDMVKEDVNNAIVFLGKSVEHSFNLLNQHLSLGEVYGCCYPTMQSGFYGGDYTEIFGMIILNWAYDILKQKNTSSKERFILNAYKAVATAKKLGAILVQKKSSPLYDEDTTSPNGKRLQNIEAALEKYKKKLEVQAAIKPIFSVKDYYIQGIDDEKKSESILNSYDKEERNRKRIEELYDVQESLEKELADAVSNSAYLKEKHIKNHVFIYPNVGRKIMLYTDINHFKHHLGDSVLSGIGTLMQLDIIPDNIFNNLKLCSVISGGVFDLKYDAKHQQLSFINNKKKALILNYSDSEFSKYAHIIDIRHLTTTQHNLEILQNRYEAIKQYNIGANQPLITPGTNKYPEQLDIGDISVFCKETYANYEIKKRAHLICTSSDITTCVKYEHKVFDPMGGDNKLFKYPSFVNSVIDKASDSSYSDFISTLLLKEEEKVKNNMTGEKLYFRYMRKIPSLSEDLIRDSVTFELIKTRYIYCNGVNFVKLKLGLENEKFYKQGTLAQDDKGMFYIRTIPYLVDDKYEGTNRLPKPLTDEIVTSASNTISGQDIYRPQKLGSGVTFNSGLKPSLKGAAFDDKIERNRMRLNKQIKAAFPQHIINMVKRMNLAYKKAKGEDLSQHVQSALLNRFKRLTPKEVDEYLKWNHSDIREGKFPDYQKRNLVQKQQRVMEEEELKEVIPGSDVEDNGDMEEDDMNSIIAGDALTD